MIVLLSKNHIRFNYRWETVMRPIISLTEDQQYTLKNHLRELVSGRETLEMFGFYEGETQFFRGQPETEFIASSDEYLRVVLLGHGHWKIWKHGRPVKGTRDTRHLRERLEVLID